MFADDIANCAETVAGLQEQLNIKDCFCQLIGMELNMHKTKVIIFRNGSAIRRSERWLLSGKHILRIYGYLIHAVTFIDICSIKFSYTSSKIYLGNL